MVGLLSFAISKGRPRWHRYRDVTFGAREGSADRWTSATGWQSDFKSTGPGCEPSPTAHARRDARSHSARQLASRGRRRIRGADTNPDADQAAQQEVVEAFLAAARDGDFDALVAVLDPARLARVDLTAYDSRG
jgi:hypothetical protein